MLDIREKQLSELFIIHSYAELCASQIHDMYENTFYPNKKESTQNMIQYCFMQILQEFQKTNKEELIKIINTLKKGEKL